MLGGEVLVGELGPGPIRGLERLGEGLRHARLAAVGTRQGGDRLHEPVAQRQQVGPDALEDRHHHAVLLGDERGQQVVGGDLGIRPAACQLGGRGERLLGLQCPAVRIERHGPLLRNLTLIVSTLLIAPKGPWS